MQLYDFRTQSDSSISVAIAKTRLWCARSEIKRKFVKLYVRSQLNRSGRISEQLFLASIDTFKVTPLNRFP